MPVIVVGIYAFVPPNSKEKNQLWHDWSEKTLRRPAPPGCSAIAAGDVKPETAWMMYYLGDGVAGDDEQVRAWIEKAAAQDHPNPLGLLGRYTLRVRA